MPIRNGLFAPISNTDITNRTRKFLVPAYTGWNQTDGTVIVQDDVDIGIEFPDAKLCHASAHFIVPEYFVSGMTVKLAVRTGAAGPVNMYVARHVHYAQCGELYTTHDPSEGYAAIALAGGLENDCVGSISLADAAAGDVVTVRMTRNAINALDTVNALVGVVGWLFEYTVDM